MSEKIDSNSSEKLKLGDALKKYFENKYMFDETWADMGAGFLYRRQIECIKFKYIFKLVNEVKKIKTKKNKMILNKYIDYKNKFFIYRELQAGKPSKALYHMKNLKEIKKQISDDKLTGDYIYKYLKNSILENAYRDLKEMHLKLLDSINNFLKKRSSNKKYKEQIKDICIAKEIITYYEHDLVKLNNKNKDQYGEIYKFKNDECIKYKLNIYSNNIFRWFSDEKKKG